MILDDVFRSPEARRDALRYILLLIGFIALGYIGIKLAVPGITDPMWVRARIDGYGWYAPVVFVAIQTLQVVFAPIPGQVLGGVGGFLFGSAPGVVYSMFGVLLGSSLVFLASRRLGRPYVERVITPKTLTQWDNFVKKKGVYGLFLLFLLPTFPDDMLCFVAGLSEIRLRTFLVLVLVGRTPSFVLVSYAGTRVADGYAIQATLIIVLLTLASGAVYLLRD